MDRLFRWLSRNKRVRADKRLCREIEGRDATIASLETEISQLKEQLEAERVQNRIHQLEVRGLTELCARQQQRISENGLGEQE